MFSSNKQKRQPATLVKFDTIIGSSTVIDGNLQLSGNIRVDGKVIGNISAINGQEVTIAIGEKGVIKGDIHCHHLITSGTIIGNINTSYKVEILDQAKIEGDVTYNLLSMDPGASIQGHFCCTQNQPTFDSKSLAEATIQQAQERTGL
jgi:cytoskeletal protein CcmA (bactofilin family)